MTTWSDANSFLKSKFKITSEGQGNLILNFETDTGRSQLVFVGFELMSDNSEWICIQSAFGKVGEVDLNKALEVLGDRIFGAIGKMNDLVTVKHSAPLADMNAEELVTPMMLSAHVADQLESALGLGDKF